MTDIKRVISGRQAKRRGDNFESILYSSADMLRWKVIKIPMGAKMLGPFKMIRVATPFDFVFLKKGRAIFADAKTTKGKTFSHSMITHHQMVHLIECEREDFKAGYIVNFTEIKKTVFFTATQLINTKKGESLKPEDGILIGDNIIINLDRIFPASTITQHGETISK
jgi:penicillin-binding protein-related factor A (putative recombinase)